jgi:hypothetical protein
MVEEMVPWLGKKAKRETRASNAGDAVGAHDPTRVKARPRGMAWLRKKPRKGQESESTAAILLPRSYSTMAECSIFSAFCRTLISGGTRIRTGDTMIFRSVPNPTVHRHRALWAESKRFLEGTNRRRPPLNAVGRHAVVVGLW